MNTISQLQKIDGGIGESSITIQLTTKPNKGGLLNITLDGYCHTNVKISNGTLILGTPPSAPPAVLPAFSSLPAAYYSPAVLPPAYPSLPAAYSPPAILHPAYSLSPATFAAPPAALPPAFPALPVSPLDEKSNASQPAPFGWVPALSSLPRQDFFNNTVDYRNWAVDHFNWVMTRTALQHRRTAWVVCMTQKRQNNFDTPIAKRWLHTVNW